MKKFIIVMMTLVLAFGLAACGGGDGDKEDKKDDSLKLEKLMQYNAKTGIHTKYKMDYEGSTVTTETYCKGEKLYTKTSIGGAEQIVIMDGGYMYSLDTKTKTGTKSKASQSVQDILKKSNNGSSESFEKYKDSITVGETEVDGTKYYSESFTSNEEGDEGTITYCFDGDELVYTVTESDGKKVTLKYLAYDDKVDDSVFEIPDDYNIKEV